jgi:hypothetical protein
MYPTLKRVGPYMPLMDSVPAELKFCPGFAYTVGNPVKEHCCARAIGDVANKPATTMASGAAFDALQASFWIRWLIRFI